MSNSVVQVLPEHFTSDSIRSASDLPSPDLLTQAAMQNRQDGRQPFLTSVVPALSLGLSISFVSTLVVGSSARNEFGNGIAYLLALFGIGLLCHVGAIHRGKARRGEVNTQ